MRTQVCFGGHANVWGCHRSPRGLDRTWAHRPAPERLSEGVRAGPRAAAFLPSSPGLAAAPVSTPRGRWAVCPLSGQSPNWSPARTDALRSA